MPVLTCARSDLFPVGSTVTVHPFGSRQVDGPPSAAAIAIGTVDAAGFLSINDADIVGYTTFVLYSLVGAEHRYVLARSTLDVSDLGRVVGTADLTLDSATALNAVASAGTFQTGQVLSGPGVRPGTRIANVVGGTLTLDQTASSTGVGAALSGDNGKSWVATVKRRKAAIGTA